MNKQKFMYAPDVAPGGGKTKTVKTPALPVSDVDFMDVAKAAALTWAANPVITLAWKTAKDFNNDVTAYAEALSSRQESGSKRPSLTQTLQQLDKKIDEAVTEVKLYIAKKFKKANATAQFARYGIIKENTAYVLSRDRNNRNSSFKLMIDAILADGFDKEEFGTAFWTTMQTDYAAALKLAGDTTGDISGKVATKNQQKQALKKVMTALQFVLRGNYPDTYREVYRLWGWKKENY